MFVTFDISLTGLGNEDEPQASEQLETKVIPGLLLFCFIVISVVGGWMVTGAKFHQS